MSLDSSTEIVAHFIGSFHLDIDALRLRSDYEAFRVAQKLEAETPPETPPPALRSPPLEMRDFVPGVAYVAPAEPPAPQPLSTPDPLPEALPPLEPQAGPWFEEHPLPMTHIGPVSGSGMMLLPPPPPNSILTITTQIGLLSDNDLLDYGAPDAFVAPELHMAQLATLAGLGTALGVGVGEALPPGTAPTLALAEEMAGRMTAAGEGPAAPGVTLVVAHGAAAQGILVDGATATELPVFVDLLPALLQPEEENPPEAAGDPRLDPLPDTPDPFGVDPGHAVVSGGNLAVNEALVTLRWVDAPVIAVGGSVMDLAAISQTNVMSTTAVPGALSPAPVAMNAAMIERIAAPETSAPAFAGQPDSWQVVTIEGDLTALNWVQQYVFLSDFDRAEVIFTGSATYIGFGENVVSNLTSLVELGFHYDLILVEGDMLTLTSINQTNVLLDADVVTGAPSGAAQAMGDVQVNKAQISTVGVDSVEEMTEGFRTTLEGMQAGGSDLSAAILEDPRFAGLDTVNVLHVKGNLTKLNVIEQVNVLGDSDQLHLALDRLSAEEAALVSVTAGSNAQLNAARVLDDGIDSAVMAMGGAYSDAMIHQAGLIDLDSPVDGGAMSAVVNEAVAFLADGMIDAPEAPVFAPFPMLTDHPGSADVMQTALA